MHPRRPWVALARAVHKQIDSGRPVGIRGVRVQARVVRGTLVSQEIRCRQCRVNGEPRLVRKDRSQGPLGLRSLDRPMQHGAEVRDAEVHASIGGVVACRDGGGVRGPHRRRRRGTSKKMRRLASRAGDRLVIGAGESEAPKKPDVGPLLRRKPALRKAELRERPHLGKPLQGRIARPRHLAAMRGRGDVAGAEPRVVVGGADDRVEVRLRHASVPSRRPRRSPGPASLSCRAPTPRRPRGSRE